jgi:hypothetical protein
LDLGHEREPQHAVTRHHIDYAFFHPERQLVETTSAAEDEYNQQAGDAPDVSKKSA